MRPAEARRRTDLPCGRHPAVPAIRFCGLPIGVIDQIATRLLSSLVPRGHAEPACPLREGRDVWGSETVASTTRDQRLHLRRILGGHAPHTARAVIDEVGSAFAVATGLVSTNSTGSGALPSLRQRGGATRAISSEHRAERVSFGFALAACGEVNRQLGPGGRRSSTFDWNVETHLDAETPVGGLFGLCDRLQADCVRYSMRDRQAPERQR